MKSKLLVTMEQYETLKEEIRKRKLFLFLKPVKVRIDGTAIIEVIKLGNPGEGKPPVCFICENQ